MAGIDRTYISQQFIRMINLVAFDVCPTDEITISQPADPLSFIIKCPLKEGIATNLHAPLRRCIKMEAKKYDMWVGKIALKGTVEIWAYQKSLRTPSYLHGLSPQDKDS